MLEVMPLGTSMAEVICIVNKHRKWSIGSMFDHRVFIIGPSGPSMGGEPDAYRTLIGEKSMRIHLGQYYAYFFIQTDVVAFLAFDGDSKLIEIAIRKSMNVL
jgi:hypothetical protein